MKTVIIIVVETGKIIVANQASSQSVIMDMTGNISESASNVQNIVQNEVAQPQVTSSDVEIKTDAKGKVIGM